MGIGSRKDSLKPTLNHKKNENIISNKIHTANIQIGKRKKGNHTTHISNPTILPVSLKNIRIENKEGMTNEDSISKKKLYLDLAASL